MPQTFLELVREQARKNPARIVFPETFDERTLQACAQILKEGTAHPILIGEPQKLAEDFKKFGLTFDQKTYTIIDMAHDDERRQHYAQALFELRQEKGMTLDAAQKLMTDLNYFAVMVVKMNDADGLISGANTASSNTLKPALQIMKTKEPFHKVSGFFFMVLQNRPLLFADCMVNIEPDAHELAEIAIDTAQTAKRFGIEPRIAMLSFSTNGSAKHPSPERVREATARVRYLHPELLCEGEMQVDAALVPEICARKFPNSKVPGNANILIFPNLDSANIAYKLVERLGHAQA
ncbi:MAG: phosphate acyltransferase, partial [Patescibacteria group bacterium]